MLSPIKSLKPSTQDRYSHVGIVINNNDPTKNCRLQIRLPEEHRGVLDANLPWAIPEGYSGPNGGNGQVGGISIPAVGSKVWVSFLDGSPYHLKYGGLCNIGANIPSELKESYPNAYGWIDNFGNKFFVDTSLGTVTFTHKSGSTINIDSSGNISATSSQDLNLEAVGSINIVAGGNLTLGAPTINLDYNTLNQGVSPPPSPQTTSSRNTPSGSNESGNINL